MDATQTNLSIPQITEELVRKESGLQDRLKQLQQRHQQEIASLEDELGRVKAALAGLRGQIKPPGKSKLPPSRRAGTAGKTGCTKELVIRTIHDLFQKNGQILEEEIPEKVRQALKEQGKPLIGFSRSLKAALKEKSIRNTINNGQEV